MQQRKTLTELASDLETQLHDKRDLVADTRQLLFQRQPEENRNIVTVEGNGKLDVSPIAMHQITDRLGIPRKYAQRMETEFPSLLEENVNGWFEQKPERRMLRTFQSNGTLRAFLSDRFRTIDNFDVAKAAFPMLKQGMEKAGLEIKSCELTERRMYIQGIFPSVESKMDVGAEVNDVVQSGFVLSNSEIGMGAFSVTPLVYRLVCKNGMILPKEIDGYAGLRKTHLGARIEAGENMEVWQDDTLKARDELLLKELRDALSVMMDRDRFVEAVAQMERLANRGPAIANPIKAVEVMTKTMPISEKESEGILTSLLKDSSENGMGRWGLANAITAQANVIEDYDRAVEFEELGGKIITLPASNWERIAEAA